MHSEALQDHCEQDDKGDDMTQVLIDRATLEQLVAALNNAEDALNNSQALIAGRERFGFAKPCYAANEIALGFVSPAIAAGRAALANAERVEPIAFGRMIDGVIADVICPETHEVCGGGYTVPLYTQPLSANSSAKTLQELAVKGCGKCFYQDCDFPNCCKPKMLSDILKDTP